MSVKLKIKNREWLTKIKNSETGIGLLEAVLAVCIFGGAVLAIVMSLSGGAMSVRMNDELATAQGLARTQLEYTKQYAYNASATTYPTVTPPTGYGITVTVTSVPNADNNIQKITVDVARNTTTLITLEDYKENR